jgi:hypothetical protein
VSCSPRSNPTSAPTTSQTPTMLQCKMIVL